MFNIEIEVEDNLSEIFDGFVSNFHLIANNIRKVAKFIEQKTEDKGPLDTGLLEASFDYHIVDENSNFVEVEMGYYAISPKNNFQYALVQHEKKLFTSNQRRKVLFKK